MGVLCVSGGYKSLACRLAGLNIDSKQVVGAVWLLYIPGFACGDYAWEQSKEGLGAVAP